MGELSIGVRLNAKLRALAGADALAPPPEPELPPVTFGYGPAERSQLTPSFRSTSNSRGPGQEGTVWVENHSQLVTCRDCGGRMLDTIEQGRHAVRLVAIGVRENCIGRRVE